MKDFSKLPKKVAIVGGGYGGITAAKSLIENDIDFDLIEKEVDFGGLWNIHLPASRRVYNSAHLISNKSSTQLSDFPMPKDYPVYPNHKLMLTYIKNIAEKFHLKSKALLNTKLENLHVNESGACELTFNSGEKKVYGGVIISTGLLNRPVIPEYKGTFSGKIMHSGEYLEPTQFKGKKVLVVGSGNSGCDIAVDLFNFCDKVIHSARKSYHFMPKFINGLPYQDFLLQLAIDCPDEHKYWEEIKRHFKIAGVDPTDYGLAEPEHPIYASHPIVNSLLLYHIGHGDIFHKPDILRLEGNTVYFTDNSFEQVDIIIYATGFRPYFPFLDKNQFNINDVFVDTFARSFDKRFPNIIFRGFFNSPAGSGALLSYGGKITTKIFQAMFNQAPTFNQYLDFISGPEPDLGNNIFQASDRHKYEYDYFKTINFLSRFLLKLDS